MTIRRRTCGISLTASAAAKSRAAHLNWDSTQPSPAKWRLLRCARGAPFNGIRTRWTSFKNRWHKPREPIRQMSLALYTSLEATSAAKEVARGLRQRGVDPDQFPESAWWVYELEVKLEAVFDLTDADVLQKSGIAEGSLTGSDVNATRQVAAEARERGYVFSGIFVLILHHHDLQIFDDLSSADTVSQSDAQQYPRMV